MKRLLLPLVASIVLPTALNANSKVKDALSNAFTI